MMQNQNGHPLKVEQSCFMRPGTNEVLLLTTIEQLPSSLLTNGVGKEELWGSIRKSHSSTYVQEPTT
jgi:hypothetical protein